MKRCTFIFIFVILLFAGIARAGVWTTNNFIYEPALGATGATEKGYFDTGLNNVDAHLGRYKTLGDPGYTDLATALTTIGSDNITLTVPAGAWVATGTIPANVGLRFLKGGYFTIANGVTLTINGPIEAGPYQIFSCTGTGEVVGGGNFYKVYPEWWGAIGDGASGNSTANTTAIAAAIAALGTYGGDVVFQAGDYYTTGGFTVPLLVNIKGAGLFNTTFHHSGSNFLFANAIATTTTDYFRPQFVDFSVIGTSSGSGALQLGGNPHGFVVYILAKNYTTGCGIYLYNPESYWCERTKIWLHSRNNLYGLKVAVAYDAAETNSSFGYSDWTILCSLEGISGGRAIYFPDNTSKLLLYNSKIDLTMWMDGADQKGIEMNAYCWIQHNNIDIKLDYASVNDGSDNQAILMNSTTSCYFLYNEGIWNGPWVSGSGPAPKALITPSSADFQNAKIKGYAADNSGTVASGDTTTKNISGLLPYQQYKLSVFGYGTGYNENAQYIVTSNSIDAFAKVEKISGGYYGAGSRITVEPKGGGTAYAYSAGDGCAIDITIDGNTPSAIAVSWKYVIEAVY